MKLSIAVSSALLLAVSVHAATYYVATNGSDANNGTATNTPFATPQKAVTLSALAAGDTIFVRGGTYALSAQVKPGKTGTAAKQISNAECGVRNVECGINPNAEAAVANSVGSPGHWPVPGGDPPLGMGKASGLFRAPVFSANVLPVPSGQWSRSERDGSPVPPSSASAFGI